MEEVERVAEEEMGVVAAAVEEVAANCDAV